MLNALKFIVLSLFVLTSSSLYAQDVRILIDVSGSMKKNDPNKLRISATQLLTNLLPSGTKAGIWTFSTTPKVLAPNATVNKRWKKKTLTRLNQINSKGQYTDIRKALLRVTKDWRDSKASDSRVLIILTDGKVDVAKDPDINAKAREKLLKDTLPILKKHKIKVFSIGLSKDSDHQLLKELAYKTSGLYQMVLDSKALEDAFYNVFNAAVERNEVPIESNTFSIDASIRELTLVLHYSKDNPFKIIQPNDKPVLLSTKNTFKTKKYALITIDSPPAGEWTIIGLQGKSNRAIILSDIKLKTNTLGSNMFAGEKINYIAYLENKDARIEDKALLKNTTMSVTSLRKKPLPLRPSSEQVGDFTRKLYFPYKAGPYALKTIATSKTFLRAKEQLIDLHPKPFRFSLKKISKNRRLLDLTVNTQLAKTFTVTATLRTGKKNRKLPVKKLDDTSYSALFDVFCHQKNYRVYVFVKGQKLDQQPFELQGRYIQEKCPSKPYLKSSLQSIDELKLNAKTQLLKSQISKILPSTFSVKKPITTQKKMVQGLSTLALIGIAILTFLTLSILTIGTTYLLKKKQQKNTQALLKGLDDD